jgi:hypothetical protein
MHARRFPANASPRPTHPPLHPLMYMAPARMRVSCRRGHVPGYNAFLRAARQRAGLLAAEPFFSPGVWALGCVSRGREFKWEKGGCGRGLDEFNCYSGLLLVSLPGRVGCSHALAVRRCHYQPAPRAPRRQRPAPSQANRTCGFAQRKNRSFTPCSLSGCGLLLA